MGNTTSVAAGKECLTSAVGNDLVAFSDAPNYQVTDAHPRNQEFPVTPVAVTYPETSDQIAAIVRCASEYGRKVQPRSGGHSLGNYGLGGRNGSVVVDMKHFQQVSIDEKTHRATIGSATPVQDLSHKLAAGNRAMTHGNCPTVGAGGHLSIGGIGPTARQWGLAVDHIEEVEAVLANGSVVRASSSENSDLLFAIKGAAPSMAIVTEFTVRTEPAPPKAVKYNHTLDTGDGSIEQQASAFSRWQKFISEPKLTRNLDVSLTIQGPGVLEMTGTFYGSKQEYDALGIEKRLPLSRNTTQTLDGWPSILNSTLADPGWVYSYDKTVGITSDNMLPHRAAVQLMNDLSTGDPNTDNWSLSCRLVGGAVNDPAVDATAFPHRDILYWITFHGRNPNQPLSPGTFEFLDHAYSAVNGSFPGRPPMYIGDLDVRASAPQPNYWRSNLPRLEEIKAKIDPKDILYNPQGVRAAKGGSASHA